MEKEVFDYLKQSCKRQGMTYKDVANAMDLSEASVKRIFSAKKCSLEQFHDICDCLHVHPAEIYSNASIGEGIFHVSKKLEDYFLENYHIFLFYRQLCFASHPDEVKKKNGLTAKSMKVYLNELRDQGLIKLGQRGKVELLQPKTMQLQRNGRLMKRVREEWVPFFIEKTQEQGNTFNHLFETFSMSLSPSSAEVFKIRLLELKEEFFAQAEKDKRTLKEDKGISLLFAMGPYRMAIDGDIPQIQQDK